MPIVTAKQDLITIYIQRRIKENKNFLAMFTGSTGSGKSYSALKQAEKLNPDFNISRCAFSAREFMDILTQQQLKSGDALVWDEIGVGQSSRSWQSVSNKLINYVMQSFRKMNLIVLMTCPDVSFLDIGTRKLLHCLFETQAIDMKEKRVRTKPLFLTVNQRSGKIYAKYLRVITKDGVAPLVSYSIGLPSQNLIDAYESKKQVFLSDLNKRVYHELNALEKKEMPKETEAKPKLTTQQERIINLIKAGQLIPAIAKQFNVKQPAIYEQIQLMAKKGIEIKSIKKGIRVIGYNILGI